MGALSPMHWAIIVIVVLLLFGSRKLPDLARGVGQSLRIFKAETSELRGEGDKGSQGQTPAVEKGGSASDAGSAASSEPSAASSASSGPAAPGASAGSGTETTTTTTGTPGSDAASRVGESR